MTPTGPFFDRDKAQISDALGVSQRIQALQAPPPDPPGAVRPHAAPSTYQIPAGAPNPGARFGAPPPAVPQQQPMAGRLAGGQVGLQGPNGGININLGPNGMPQGGSVNANMGKFDVGAALNNAMQLQNMQARYSPNNNFSASANYAPGQGFGGGVQYQNGPFSASANYAPGQGFGGDVQYQNGPFSAGGGYDQNRGAYANLGVRKQFQEGGLASSLRTDPVYHDRAVDFLDMENRHMREMVGKHAAHGGFSVKKR
jgi:hypothetical protein